MLLILTGVLGGAGFAGYYFGLYHKPSFFWQTLVFLAFATAVLVRYLLRAKSNLFLQLFLFSIVLKMIAFLAYCFVIVLKDKDGALENIAFFLTAYFCYTALEIAFLHRRISQ